MAKESSNEPLSEDEVNALLDGIGAAYDKETKRPKKFSREQIKAITYIHQTFAYLATRSLSAHLRSVCQLHFLTIDELTYDEYIRAMPERSTIATINMNPLKGNVILKIDPKLTFAIIDRVCGGFGDGTKFQHELTDIEKSIMDNVIVLMLGNLREAWNQALDIHPQVKTIDNCPQSVRIVSPNEIVVLVTLETKIGDTEGTMVICFPCSTIGPAMDKLSNWYWNKNPDSTPSSATEKPSEEEKENEGTNFKSFAYLNRVYPDDLSDIIQFEHPRIIALVLAHMEAGKAADVLQNLPYSIQSHVVWHIATMDKVRLEIVSAIERVLENKLIALPSDKKKYSIVGGIESTVEILNLADQSTKNFIIEELEKEDHVVAEEIQKRGINHEET